MIRMSDIGLGLGLIGLSLVVAFTGALIVMAFCNRYLGLWACKIMGWHYVDGKVGFDGASMTGKCSRCGKSVLRDSQGNWF